MNTFRKWNGKRIEDWGATNSDDSKSFYRAFKNYLKREFPEAEIIGFKPNHYDTSGFIKLPDGRCIYISHSIDRDRERVDFNDSSVMNGVLYRTAKNEKDYHGGPNNFCSMFKLETSVRHLFDQMEIPTEGVKESKMIRENFDAQKVLQKKVDVCHKDKYLAKKVLSMIQGEEDKKAVEDVISSGLADKFGDYDTFVCDKFLRAYDFVRGNSSAMFLIKDSAITEESVNEDFTVNLDFEVELKKHIDPEKFDTLVDKLAAGDVIVYDIDRGDQEFKVNYPYTFEGKIYFDDNGDDTRTWTFIGAPSNADEKKIIVKFISDMMKIIHSAGVDLSNMDFDVERKGKSMEDTISDLVDRYKKNIISGESVDIEAAVNDILEGKSLSEVVGLK